LDGPNGYRLSGITMVGENIKIKKMVDRCYPDYNFPSNAKIRSECPLYDDYMKFLDYKMANGMVVKRFAVGHNDQFVLEHEKDKYPDFEIRNLCGNGEVWTGTGTDTKKMYSGDPLLFDENMDCCGIRMKYGKFTYYNAGDLSGMNYSQYASQERDFESQVAPVCGEVTVYKADHHGWRDATNETLLKTLRPKVILILSSHNQQPYSATVARMTNKLLYPDDRDLYVTSPASKSVLGNTFNLFKPYGHVVIRVYAGGTSYQVFVLDEDDTSSPMYPVIYASGVKMIQ